MTLFSLAACETKEKITGTFYTLQEAYDEGFLTQQDLQSIAYYQNGEFDNPTVLSAETEKAIKETRADILRDLPNPVKSAKAEDVSILKYYGKYECFAAIMITDAYTDYIRAERDVTVAGVLFHYSDGNDIVIWKSNLVTILPKGGDNNFELSAIIDEALINEGKITVVVNTKNLGEAYSYTGNPSIKIGAYAELYCRIGEQKYYMACEYWAVDDMPNTLITIEENEIITNVYVFNNTGDYGPICPSGVYSLRLSYRGAEKIYENIINYK
jgi:hypothetical protein